MIIKEIQGKVLDIVNLWAENSFSKIQFGSNLHLISDFGLDSVSLLNVVSDVEKTFNLVISDEDISNEKFLEFNSLVTLVSGKLNDII